MNVQNNKRKRLSQEKIEKAFVTLLQGKELNQITVTDICKMTGLNRTTFYNNYLDIYDLADKIRLKLINDVKALYEDERIKKLQNKGVKNASTYFIHFDRKNLQKGLKEGEEDIFLQINKYIERNKIKTLMQDKKK